MSMLMIMSICLKFVGSLIVLTILPHLLPARNCDTMNMVCLGEEASDVDCLPVVENVPTDLSVNRCRTFIAGYLNQVDSSIDWTLTVPINTKLTTFRFWLTKQLNDSSVMMVVNVTNSKDIMAYSVIYDLNSKALEGMEVYNSSTGSFLWRSTFKDEDHIHVNFESGKDIATYLPKETVPNMVTYGRNSSSVPATIDLTNEEVYAHIQVIEFNSTTEIFQVKTSSSKDVIDLFDKVSNDTLTEEQVINLIEREEKKTNLKYIIGLTVGGICLVLGVLLMLYLTGGEPPQTIITSDDSEMIIGVYSEHLDNEHEDDEHGQNENEKNDEKEVDNGKEEVADQGKESKDVMNAV